MSSSQGNNHSAETGQNIGLRRFTYLAVATSIMAIIAAESMMSVILRHSYYDSLAFDAATSSPPQRQETEIASAADALKQRPREQRPKGTTTKEIPPQRTITKATAKKTIDPSVDSNDFKLLPNVFDDGMNDEKQKRRHLLKITEPWSNVSTVGYWRRNFYSGFRNQIMALSTIVMWSAATNYSQILLPTIKIKDTFGTDKYIPFEQLFDIEHWNSFYPFLPRFVHCDQSIFTDYQCDLNKWVPGHKSLGFFNGTATKPYLVYTQEKLFRRYKLYSKNVSNAFTRPLFKSGYPNPVDVAMLRGALRPHPDLQALIGAMLKKLSSTDDDSNNTIEDNKDVTDVPYMTLHARVEPDMIAHNFCNQYKVVNLTQIFEWMEEKWPTAPAKHIFMPINRQYMEKEGFINKEQPNATNWIAVENLRALNKAVSNGLWNGTAKVFEFGANALKGTKYEVRPSTTGALINFYLAIKGNIFIGTPVSSYSHDLLTTRYFRNLTENYKYVPEGLVHWTPNGQYPEGFNC